MKNLPEATERTAAELCVDITYHPVATIRIRLMQIRDRFNADSPRSNRSEWRTALVPRELARYKVDIEKGQLEEVGAGYIFFWSGHPRAERRDAGVAFDMRNDILERLLCLPQGINDRLMGLRLPPHEGKFTTILGVYAPR
nr:unnamed protein product [Spirometra erinaceieuropaei]